MILDGLILGKMDAPYMKIQIWISEKIKGLKIVREAKGTFRSLAFFFLRMPFCPPTPLRTSNTIR